MADSLLKEVDDALRADRAGALWRKHRRFIITLGVIVIAATAANSAWQSYREARGGRILAALVANQQLLEHGNISEAAEGFQSIAAGADGDFKDLALIWQSRALMAAHKKPEAIAALSEAVASGDGLWNDVACLRLAGLDADAAKPCLAASNTSPLAHTRFEWHAAAAWARGEPAIARTTIAALLADPETDANSRARLVQWQASIDAMGTK